MTKIFPMCPERKAWSKSSTSLQVRPLRYIDTMPISLCYVLEGSIVTQLKGDSPQTVHAGDVFYESPTDVHIVSRNASETQPAKLLVFYVKAKGAPPTVLLKGGERVVALTTRRLRGSVSMTDLRGGKRASTRRICVFCGSSVGANPKYLAVAKSLGKQLAAGGWGLVYGGTSIGLMGAIADAALSGGVEVIGVLPRALQLPSIAHRGLTKLQLVGESTARTQGAHGVFVGCVHRAAGRLRNA